MNDYQVVAELCSVNKVSSVAVVLFLYHCFFEWGGFTAEYGNVQIFYWFLESLIVLRREGSGLCLQSQDI